MQDAFTTFIMSIAFDFSFFRFETDTVMHSLPRGD